MNDLYASATLLLQLSDHSPFPIKSEEPTTAAEPFFPCLFCDLNFESKNLRKAHIKDAHSAVDNKENKDRRCKVCYIVFSRSHDLKRHSLSHSKLRAFACDICNRAFSRRDALKRHSDRIGGCQTRSTKID